MQRWTLGIVAAALVFSLGALSAPAARNEGKTVDQMLLHNVFFTLKDDTEANRTKLIDNCKKYLVDHPGVVHFAVGPRVPDLNREVNATDFTIGLHILFKDKEAHDKYQPAADHQKFIAESKDLWKAVKVYDTYVEAIKPKS